MTYGHRANLRKECTRFLRFAYLVDFLAMEGLTSIYVNSVKDMITKLERLDGCDNSHMADDAVYKKTGAEPLFLVGVKFDPEIMIAEHEWSKDYPKEFKLPPHGNSKVEEFDPTIHLELTPELEEG